MLSDRKRQVLCALIEEYISCALPVGSKTLTDHYALGVSSATIRNELSMLEELGYITQPHTSAGRIPTDYGYRVFVDKLLSEKVVDPTPEYVQAVNKIRETANEVDDLLEQTSAALSRMTDCLSIVLAPSVIRARLKQISLISFTPTHVLLVIVTDDGQVFNRHIDIPEPLEPQEVAHIQNMLNEALLGKSLEEVENGLDQGVKRALANPALYRLLAETLNCLRDNAFAHNHRLGLTTLLAKPEFSISRSIVPVLEVLEDDTILLEIVDDVIHSDSDPTIRIGSENVAEGLSGVSLVASHYGRGSTGGIVAVIGPTRMDYSRAISAVRAACANLEDI